MPERKTILIQDRMLKGVLVDCIRFYSSWQIIVDHSTTFQCFYQWCCSNEAWLSIMLLYPRQNYILLQNKFLQQTYFRIQIVHKAKQYQIVLICFHKIDTTQKNKYHFYSMQSLLSKELKTTILKEISQLNKTNAQYYCLLKKLNQTSYMLNEPFSQKLESMKNDIKEKIKQLAHNVDTMYQCIDKKIGIIVQRIGGIIEQNNKYQNMVKGYQQRIKQMIALGKINDEKINSLIIKNEHLSHKNNALTAEIENINNYKKKYDHENTNTYDSMGSFREKQDLNRRATQSGYKRRQNSYQHLSPIKQPNTNSMIEQSKNLNIASSKKLIKSEQNSFSSMLIKEQNQQKQNYNSLKQRDGICANNNIQSSSKLGFGCMPVSSSNLDGTKVIIFNHMKSSNPESQVENEDDNQKVHRMSFLMQNLQMPPKSHRTLSNEFNQTLNSVKSNRANQHFNHNQMIQSQNQVKIRQNNLLSSNKMQNRSFNKQEQYSINSINREQLQRNYNQSPVKRYQI